MRVIVGGEQKTIGRQQRWARIVLALGLLGLGVWIINGFLSALVWAGILVVALWPTYSRAVRAWPSGERVALPIAFTLLVALVFVVPLLLLALQISHDSHDFLVWFKSVEASGIPVPAWMHGLPLVGSKLSDWWSQNLATPFEASDFLQRLNRESLVSVGREFGIKFAHRLVTFAFMLLTLFFLFKDGRRLAQEIIVASQTLFGPRGEHLARQMVASIHGTVDGLVLVGLGEGFFIGLAYYFAKVPHPALFGAVTAIAAMIPFGAFVAFGGAGLFLLAQGQTAAAVIVAIYATAVVLIADHFVRPVLIGGATELPFIWVLLGILGGVETFGLLGLFLGPAVMSALILIWRELVASNATTTRQDLAA